MKLLQSLKYHDSVSKIKNALKDKPEILKVFVELTNKTDLFVKNSEISKLNPIYEKAKNAFKLLDSIRIALKRIGWCYKTRMIVQLVKFYRTKIKNECLKSSLVF